MDLDTPPDRPAPPPPGKRLDRPKITLQIPGPNTTMTRGSATTHTPMMYPYKYQGRPPGTPASHASGPHINPYFNPFGHMTYHNKASEFMFKQFEGFKDFTMNTAKSGLSVGEKTAFWFYNKLRLLSKKWFTHFFLTLCLVLYSVIGALVFMTLEGPNQEKYVKKEVDVRKEMAEKIQETFLDQYYYVNSLSNDDLIDIIEAPFIAYESVTKCKTSFLLRDKYCDLKDVRREIVLMAEKIQKVSNDRFLNNITDHLQTYENNYTECMKHKNSGHNTWSFWNSVFYAGTIYTTIVVSEFKSLKSLFSNSSTMKIYALIKGR